MVFISYYFHCQPSLSTNPTEEYDSKQKCVTFYASAQQSSTVTQKRLKTHQCTHLFIMETSALIWCQPCIHLNIISPKMAASSQTNTLKSQVCWSCIYLSSFFKTIHVFTPALGQAQNVTAYAWSNKNRVLHQGNRVRQSLAHLQTFKSWNNMRNPSKNRQPDAVSLWALRRPIQSGTQRSGIHLPCQYERYKTFIKT